MKAKEHGQAAHESTGSLTREDESVEDQKELGSDAGTGPRRDEEEEKITSITHSRSTSHTTDTTPQPDITPPAANEKDRQIALSRTTSVTPDAVVVPRANRRGLFARFTLIPEVQNPHHYTRRTKWFLTFIVAFCAMAGPMGSAIVMPVLEDIAIAFHASHAVANLSVAVYMLSMAIFPLWWSSFSERLGRRTIYITSFALFTLFAVLSAVSTNIAMLVVMRTLSGGAAASVQAVGAGSIADMWEVRERGRAMGIFYLGPLCGPLFAPIIGGAIGSTLGWRSTQWFLVIYGGATLVFIIFALPETLAKKPEPSPQLTRTPTSSSAAVEKTKSLLIHTQQIFLDPLKIITWLRHPPVALTVYYASITFGCLYVLNISIQSTFAAPPYRFSTLIIGLLYIPNSVGYLLASLFGGKWIDSIMHREARKAGRYDNNGKLVFRPEDRMKENAWIAAVLWPGALLCYGWTVQKGVMWVVPMVANCTLCFLSSFFSLGSPLFSFSTSSPLNTPSTFYFFLTS